jgi:hypothetical protein
MGRWSVMRPFKANYPGKPAMFKAARERLGVGGRFTCRGSNGRQSYSERTYEITEYGFDWVEEAKRRSGRGRRVHRAASR